MPLLPDVTVIHDASLAAVQLQLLEVLTLTLPAPPPEPKDWLVGTIL